jgi:mycothiol system anti-sigma-R factor
VSCQRTQELLHGYLDGELDLTESLEVERHMHECQSCARAYTNQTALRSAFKDSSLYYSAPARLRKRIRSSLRQANKAEAPARSLPWRWLAVGASPACALLIALVIWSALPGRSGPSRDELLAQEVVSDHVRSLMGTHLTDVASSDQHTVKPWFDGKIDFAPVVKDFSDQGYPLVGGRIEYLNNRTAAALVYQRQKHFINVFIWPSEESADSEAKLTTRQGYNLIHWTRGGMTYWAVSDLNGVELQELVRLIQEQTPPRQPSR